MQNEINADVLGSYTAQASQDYLRHRLTALRTATPFIYAPLSAKLASQASNCGKHN